MSVRALLQLVLTIALVLGTALAPASAPAASGTRAGDGDWASIDDPVDRPGADPEPFVVDLGWSVDAVLALALLPVRIDAALLRGAERGSFPSAPYRRASVLLL